MCTIITERRVREKLEAHFGADHVEQVEPLAVAVIQEDGSVTVRELDAVC